MDELEEKYRREIDKLEGKCETRWAIIFLLSILLFHIFITYDLVPTHCYDSGGTWYDGSPMGDEIPCPTH